MADTGVQVDETIAKNQNRTNLKYLWVVPTLFEKVLAFATSLYIAAKDKSGPLKPSVVRVENTVKSILTPVYGRVDGKPQAILAYFDRKGDDGVQFLDGNLPPTVKEYSRSAYDATRSTLADVQKDGIFSTARGYYEKYEPIAQSYGVKAYKKALTFPLVPEAVALTRYGAVKVNSVTVSLKDGGLPLAGYLPLLPVDYFDKITKTE